jgi:WD40 repeat protein
MTTRVFFVCWILALGSTCFSQTKTIKQLQKIASDNEQRAMKAEELNETFNRMAQDAQRETERQRYLALAINVSRESLEVDDNALAALLALQAYNFNSKHQGYVYDRDVYGGLLQALERFDKSSLKLQGSGRPILTLTSEPGSKSIRVLEKDGRVTRWSDQSGEWEEHELIPSRNMFTIYATTIKPDGRLLVIGARKQPGGETEIFDLAYSSRQIRGIKSEIIHINFIPNEAGFFALGDGGRTIYQCDQQYAIPVIKSEEEIKLMDLSDDGTKLAGVTTSGNLMIWDVMKRFAGVSYKIGVDGGQTTSMAFAPNGRDIFLGTEKGSIKILAAETGIVTRTLLGRFLATEQIIFSSSGKLMAVTDKTNSIRIWNLTDLSKMPLHIKADGAISSVTFSSDDQQIFCAFREKELPVRVWSLVLETMANELCRQLTRNLSKVDWNQYVSPDVDYQATCSGIPKEK